MRLDLDFHKSLNIYLNFANDVFDDYSNSNLNNKNYYRFYIAYLNGNSNDKFTLAVRFKYDEFYFDLNVKGIADFDNQKLFYSCEQVPFTKIIKRHDSYYFEEGFDGVPKFFFFIPKLFFFSEIFNLFTEVNFKKSSFFFLKIRQWRNLAKDCYFGDSSLADKFTFGNLTIENYSNGGLVDKKMKVYEIYYQDLFFFGPYKHYKKSLTLKAQYNIDQVTFESNIDKKSK